MHLYLNVKKQIASVRISPGVLITLIAVLFPNHMAEAPAHEDTRALALALILHTR